MRTFENHPRIPRSVAEFLATVAARPDVEGLVLFGSRAFGDCDDRSDVDIAVMASTLSRLEWARLRNSAYEARSLFWISLTHFEANPAELKKRITQTGELIYVAAKTIRQLGEFGESDRES